VIEQGKCPSYMDADYQFPLSCSGTTSQDSLNLVRMTQVALTFWELTT
jgi:hypothetical protein